MAKVKYIEKLKTVAEWIEILKEYPQDNIVVMSKDGEGNDFSPLADAGTGLYVADTTWSGAVYNDDEADSAGKDAVQAVILWPTN